MAISLALLSSWTAAIPKERDRWSADPPSVVKDDVLLLAGGRAEALNIADKAWILATQ